jgi:hypothetical protein
VREPDDRTDECRLERHRAKTVDEALVDLHDIQREATQRAK